ncbi:MAG: BON domain-containing protein [Deltaproteobacteria bacterium]
MRRTKPKETSREGKGSSPPRFASEQFGGLQSAHQVELDVQRELLAHPSLHFASLVVRRINNGVCLQGVLETDDESTDVCRIAQRVSGVREVLNHLVIAGGRLPPKG